MSVDEIAMGFRQEKRSHRSGGTDALVRSFNQASIERLRERFDEVVSIIVAAIRAEVPAYGVLGEHDDGVWEGVRANTALFLRLLGEGLEVNASEIAALEALGEKRARQGVPLESFQEAVRVGVQIGLELVSDDVRDHLDGDERVDPVAVLETNASTAVGFVHEVQVAVARGYRAVGREHLAPTTRKETEFVDCLIDGGWEEERTAHEAAAAGIGLSSPCGLVVFFADGADRDVVLAAVKAFSGHIDGLVVGSVRGGRWVRVPVVWPAHTSSDRREDSVAWTGLLVALDGVARDYGLVAVAEYLDRAGDAGTAYREVGRYLDEVSTELGIPGLIDGCELAFQVACGQIEATRARRIVRETLGGLLAQRRSQPLRYLETIETLSRRAHKKDAARTLGISVSSLQDRIARIRDHTGLDPNLPAEAFRLRLAATLYRMHAVAVPEPGHPSWKIRGDLGDEGR